VINISILQQFFVDKYAGGWHISLRWYIMPRSSGMMQGRSCIAQAGSDGMYPFLFWVIFLSEFWQFAYIKIGFVWRFKMILLYERYRKCMY
jgi:hypothetical protein